MNRPEATVRELVCQAIDLRPTLIRIGSTASQDLAGEIERRLQARARHVFVDRRVADAFPATVACGQSSPVDGGEALKSFAHLERAVRELVTSGLDRRGVVVAVGGGTVGDLVGMAAALHLRGVALVMVPTTLLSMVDSSVGGKTAINLPEGKNLVGTYWPAEEVWIDPRFVETLDQQEWRSGLGEVLKIAIGLDPELFELVERETARLLARDPALVAEIVERTVRAKIAVVERDPLERGSRRLLNLGHTLGHALEALSGFSLPHGVAVARGIHHAIAVARAQRRIEDADADRCAALLESFGFGADPLPPAGDLLGYLERDKKRDRDALHVVLPTAIGQSTIVETTPAAFAAGS